MLRSSCIDVCTLGASLALALGDDDDVAVDTSPAAIDCDYTEAIPESCRPPARATLKCVAALPVSDWACDAEREAAVQGVVCDAELQALVACLAGTEEGECPFENDNECDDPTGAQLCPAGTGPHASQWPRPEQTRGEGVGGWLAFSQSAPPGSSRLHLRSPRAFATELPRAP
jgi:hypothetical protein